MLFDNATGFIPHGYCLSWSGWLVGLVAGSHFLIGMSYMTIPIALFAFARRHPELNQKLIFGLFVAFILGCGTTHFVELVNIWIPFYRLDSIVLETVKTWKFHPATVDGTPVATESELIFPFNQSYPTNPA